MTMFLLGWMLVSIAAGLLIGPWLKANGDRYPVVGAE